MKIYKYKKTNKPYLKLCESNIKINGLWVKTIIYLCLYWNKDGMIWVRTKSDFFENFE